MRRSTLYLSGSAFALLGACADVVTPRATGTPTTIRRDAVLPDTSVALAPAVDTMYVGDTVTFQPYGRLVAAGYDQYWQSTESAATVELRRGFVTARAQGRTRIIMTLQTDGYPQGVADVVVLPEPPVTVTPATHTLTVGDTLSYVAGGSTVRAGHEVTWQSTNEAVATIDPRSGRVTTRSPGATRIIATAQVDGYPQAVVDLTVTPPAGPPVAEFPRARVDLSFPAITGREITVGAGGDLQAALDAAMPGDVVTLSPGATFVGNYKLRMKSGVAGGWIVVRTGGSLPSQGTRISPSDATQMPKILTPNAAPALYAEQSSQGWRLVGLEIGATADNTLLYYLVGFGDGDARVQTQLDRVPSRLTIDRSYIHGHDRLNARRCVALNSSWSAIVDSYIAECHSNDGDSQAIASWNGPGPFRIENNHLEAGHEVVGFGGPTPAVTGLIPSDIEVRRNHITRPLAWRGVWRVKNLFECKSCQRVLIEGNVMENNWADAQNGFAILLQGLTDENDAPQNRIWDVTIRNNLIRNTDSGINLLSRVAYYGGSLPRDPATRITITNNAVVLAPGFGGAFTCLQLLEDLHDVVLQNNTFVALPTDAHPKGVGFDGGRTYGLRVTDNVFGPLAYHVIGNGTGDNPSAAMAQSAPDGVLTRNVFTDAAGLAFPQGNYLARGVEEAGLTGVASGRYDITTGAPVLSQTGGRVPGVNQAALDAATAGVVR